MTSRPAQAANATGWSMTVSGSACRTTRVRKLVSSESPSIDGRTFGQRRADRREAQADHHGDERDDEPCPRTGGADVEERAPIGKPRADADEGAEGAEQEERRRGQEVRQRRGDAVPPAHEVVPGLVGEQDGEQRDRERQPGEQRPQRRGLDAGHARAGHRRRDQRDGEQQQVQHRSIGAARHPTGCESGGTGGAGPLQRLGKGFRLVHVESHGLTLTAAPTAAPRRSRADPSRTAISIRSQLFTTATSDPRAAAA